MGGWQGGGRGGRLPFDVSSIIRATLPGLCADWLGGGYLGLSPSCLEGLFHFTACLLRPHFLSLSNTPPSYSFYVILTLLAHPVTSYQRPKSPFSLSFRPIYPSCLYAALLPQLCFPLFCVDIKQLTACLVAGLQCAGRRVLLSLCIYRYFVSQRVCDYFHYAGFRDFRIWLKPGNIMQGISQAPLQPQSWWSLFLLLECIYCIVAMFHLFLCTSSLNVCLCYSSLS